MFEVRIRFSGSAPRFLCGVRVVLVLTQPLWYEAVADKNQRCRPWATTPISHPARPPGGDFFEKLPVPRLR